METITGFVNVNGKWMNHSFKGHTTVTDHYLEFHALILIMISMCMLKVKKNTYKKASVKQTQFEKDLQNRNNKAPNRGNTVLQRQLYILFSRLFISILNPFLKCKKLQNNSHTPLIWNITNQRNLNSQEWNWLICNAFYLSWVVNMTL